MDILVPAIMAAQRDSGLVIYDHGNEKLSLVEGYSTGSGEARKEADHLLLTATSQTNGVRTYVTDEAIDLTDYATLYIEWLNDGSDERRNRSYCVVSTNKTANQDTYNARIYRQSTFDFTDTPDTVDISALSGNHHVRVHAQGVEGTSAVTARVKVYKIWLEK